jgi:hypothetical protein
VRTCLFEEYDQGGEQPEEVHHRFDETDRYAANVSLEDIVSSIALQDVASDGVPSDSSFLGPRSE